MLMTLPTNSLPLKDPTGGTEWPRKINCDIVQVARQKEREQREMGARLNLELVCERELFLWNQPLLLP